jgi:hypothetical protein
MNLHFHRWLLLAATFSLAGCSFFIGSSDGHVTSNPRISHIRDRTAGIQAKAADHQLSWADSEKFLHESMGVAEMLRGMEGRGTGEQRNAAVNRYEARLKTLLARRKPIRSADAVQLGANLGELDQLYYQRWVGPTDNSDDSSSTSESTTDSTTTCETDKDKDKDKKDKDKDKKHDRDDKKRDRDHCDDDDKRGRR